MGWLKRQERGGGRKKRRLKDGLDCIGFYGLDCCHGLDCFGLYGFYGFDCFGVDCFGLYRCYDRCYDGSRNGCCDRCCDSCCSRRNGRTLRFARKHPGHKVSQALCLDKVPCETLEAKQ